MSLARSWEAAAKSGFPPEVAQILASGRADWDRIRLLLAIPEYHVPLPGGSRSSQTDLVAFGRADSGLVAIAIEGKVDESLGPTVGQKRAEKSSGVDERLRYLEHTLGLTSPCGDAVRYQLLHRTVSALLIARDFAASSAVMLVQSFSESEKWHTDFESFAALFGAVPSIGTLAKIAEPDGISLFIGWCVGDQRFRAAIGAPVV